MPPQMPLRIPSTIYPSYPSEIRTGFVFFSETPKKISARSPPEIFQYFFQHFFRDYITKLSSWVSPKLVPELLSGIRKEISPGILPKIPFFPTPLLDI